MSSQYPKNIYKLQGIANINKAYDLRKSFFILITLLASSMSQTSKTRLVCLVLIPGFIIQLEKKAVSA
jgi:hypothetical protein